MKPTIPTLHVKILIDQGKSFVETDLPDTSDIRKWIKASYAGMKYKVTENK